jgi:hypothetical protein
MAAIPKEMEKNSIDPQLPHTVSNNVQANCTHQEADKWLLPLTM